ncbi:DUF6069 family protein [Nocardia sp. NBC_00511]|uniref:DUF6069 family protein n=1 Tax=Nocardia sp. NBC_00511 TaxID=2903591 RepID=UPI0030DE05FF
MRDYNVPGQGGPYVPRAEPGYEELPSAPDDRGVDFGKLWAGGVGAGIVVALVIWVGVLLVRGVFGFSLLAPEGNGTYGNASTAGYALGGAAVALMSTGLLTLLLLFMPNPMTLFYWIMALITAVAVLVPFTLSADQTSQIATACINLVAGAALIAVLGSAARASISDPNY